MLPNCIKLHSSCDSACFSSRDRTVFDFDNFLSLNNVTLTENAQKFSLFLINFISNNFVANIDIKCTKMQQNILNLILTTHFKVSFCVPKNYVPTLQIQDILGLGNSNDFENIFTFQNLGSCPCPDDFLAIWSANIAYPPLLQEEFSKMEYSDSEEFEYPIKFRKTPRGKRGKRNKKKNE